MHRGDGNSSFIYLRVGALLIVWPSAVQTLFRDPAFVGHEGALFRVIGMAVAVIGWLYVFGGRSGAQQFGPASVLDRVVRVPVVLVPLVIAGIFLVRWGRLRCSTPRSASVPRCSTNASCDCGNLTERRSCVRFIPKSRHAHLRHRCPLSAISRPCCDCVRTCRAGQLVST